ncbi:MAG TPA: NUDIX hydrolase [Candidatus Omnitrophota bacterium]|nr:NUDIX hydrolase [Candidatus Omnitrophota bacterium]HPS21082.1 NUDIX hydrolase [Candidatus Omnitrophota bacterium]
MNISEAIAVLAKTVPDPSNGLPDDLFFYMSSITPLVNVDLLVKDETGRTLLSWRDDEHAGRGWHLPGGIVRVKESLETRVRKVAETEIKQIVDFEPTPLAINQIIIPEKTVRSHFISILYRCYLPKGFVPDNKGMNSRDPGYLQWFDACPCDLLKYHDIYKKYF